MRRWVNAQFKAWFAGAAFYLACCLASANAQSLSRPTLSPPALPAPVTSSQSGLAPAQSAPALTADDLAAIDAVVDDGKALEKQRRWGEALAHYEEALHEYPDATKIRDKFELAKLHYDLGRRFADKSYATAVGEMTSEEALNLYHEVLLKIQSHYVQEPNWKRLVAWGCSGLEVALTEPDFLATRVSPQLTAAKIDAFRVQLRTWIGSQQVAGRLEARDIVATVARMTEDRLGVRPAITIMEFTCGATNSLDDYSTFLTAEQLDEVYSQIDGNFVGLGVELKSSGGALLIVNVIPGSPAERVGIRAGDSIVAIEGRSTTDLTTDQAAGMLQGAEGSLVELTARTPGATPGEDNIRRVSVRREHVDVPSVADIKMLDPEAKIGYFKLICFQKTTTRDLDDALWKLNRQGMKSLVMDLRGNPGGLLTTSVEVADKFIEQGTIVSTKGRNPHEDFTYSAHVNGTWQVPLVVLIDGDSASASEIFAGCIRDHQRGTIIGQRSYGKGSVQGIFPLSPVHNLPAAGLRLTTARFFSPQGRPFSKVGVEPDLKVQLTAKPADGELITPSDDPFIAAALGALRNLARR